MGCATGPGCEGPIAQRPGPLPDRANSHNVHALGADLLGQTFAVIRQGGLRRRIGKGGLRQRQLVLDRGNVDDHTGTLIDNERQKRAS
jgi:hypothetical protein